ncbi:MAG: 4-alpha-glucanotransferase [Sphingobium sp.]|nr:4-alpha-glucanotransferase [Sphingobium sp.]
MNALHALAREAGLARCWTDADGEARLVADADLRAILEALGLPAGTDAAIAQSRERLQARRENLPALLTADAGAPIVLPSALHGVEVSLFDEADRPVAPSPDAKVEKGFLPPLDDPGYYRLVYTGGETTIAVAPQRCPDLASRTGDRRCWGVALQIPSLWGDGAEDFGDFGILARAVAALGKSGADAVALSPIHAQFPADPGRFTPYSPSSRIFLNGLFAACDAQDPAQFGMAEDGLIDWCKAGPEKMAALQRDFDRLDPQEREALERFREQGGEALLRQARFDLGESPDDEDAVAFLSFLQWRARDGINLVQRAARDTGMAIGLITDLAVGVDPAGGDVRADPGAFLQGLRIGAPPDPLGPLGQDWGLAGYSPQGLRDRGFAPFIAMLRANMPRGGGIRIDHGFGLQRLWVMAESATAAQGAYLDYPFDDLLRLVKLEALRADAVVIAEDLGTRPPGFTEAMEAAGIYGMAVLPFSRDEEGRFRDAAAYPATAVAMSGTHDTPTLAGWWTGRDLEWRRRIGHPAETDAERDRSRAALWDAIGAGAPLPSHDEDQAVIDSAFAFLGATPSPLVIVPMEDVVGMIDQPNLPGTIDEHPNWRQRLPDRMDALLERDDVKRRIARLATARRS